MNARLLVGWNIRRLRVDRQLTIDQLASDAGIERSYLGVVELGKKAVSVDILEKIAEGLGVPIGELFQPIPKGAPKPPTMPPGVKPRRPRRPAGPAKKRS